MSDLTLLEAAEALLSSCGDWMGPDRPRIHGMRYEEALRQAIEAERAKGDGWIPCSERLPSDGVSKIIYGRYDDGDPYVMGGFMYDGKAWECSDDRAKIPEVLAWQDYPAPPKETP